MIPPDPHCGGGDPLPHLLPARSSAVRGAQRPRSSSPQFDPHFQLLSVVYARTITITLPSKGIIGLWLWLDVRGTVGVTRPNVIWLDFDFECRQVDLGRRLVEKLTSPDVEKIDFKATWIIIEEIQTEERNHYWRKCSKRTVTQWFTKEALRTSSVYTSSVYWLYPVPVSYTHLTLPTKRIV